MKVADAPHFNLFSIFLLPKVSSKIPLVHVLIIEKEEIVIILTFLANPS